ncbi:MAG TPA: hypothetical protein VHJ20_19430 [Polyangia bacterium]|nr:hypothetical protein [Polyangia bacterium]
MRAPSPIALALTLTFAFVRVGEAAPRPRTRATIIDVAPIGARATAATPELRARVRDLVAARVRALAATHVLFSPSGYVVDGSVDELTITSREGAPEISCGVRLILSGRASGAMIAMTTGQAAFRGGRRALDARAQARLVLDVLDDATRAALDELEAHFSARRKS